MVVNINPLDGHVVDAGLPIGGSQSIPPGPIFGGCVGCEVVGLFVVGLRVVGTVLIPG